MKILILSPYTNFELRSNLHLKEYSTLEQFLVKKMGLSDRAKIKDVAPWVGHLISELEKVDGIELVSVSPQIKMRDSTESFKHNNTKYYFYSADFSQASRLIGNFKLWKKIETCSRRVRVIVDIEKPDVILLFGTENPTTSAPILSLTDYPVFCILQTVYHKPDRAKYSKPDKMIMQLETEILHKIRFFGTSSTTFLHLLKNISPDVEVLKYKWVTTPLPNLSMPAKEYDFVNFAFNMDARKGDEDSIRALQIVSEKYPHVTLNIAGGISLARKKYLKGIISELGMDNNISFTPMFEKKEDMYRHILKSRYALLPVKLDLVSTTTREAMFYQIPVITNGTSGTTTLNKEKERVLLAERDNTNSLAEQMLRLLEDEKLGFILAENAREYMVEQMNNKEGVEHLIETLEAVISYHKDGIPIQEKLKLKTESNG